jgi:hypothetical protein
MRASDRSGPLTVCVWIAVISAGLASPLLADETGGGASMWTIDTPWLCLRANHRCIKYDHDANQIGEPIDGCGDMSGYYSTSEVTAGCTT